MLVLLRKPGESVYLTGGIEIRVLEFRNGGVRLGFVAPETVQIVRDNAKLRTPKPRRIRRCEDCGAPLEPEREHRCHSCVPPFLTPRVPMDGSPGNPTPVSCAAKIEGRIDL